MESLIVGVVAAYLAIGLLFGIFFAFKGAALLDPVATGAPLGFRILVLPGAVALWPLLLVKLLVKRGAAA